VPSIRLYNGTPDKVIKVSRGLLPENIVTKDESDFGDIHHSIDFLLSNFIEMNKLWVRMQFQGSKMDQEKRESERMMLQDLVGKNLTYLSQLDALDFKLYSNSVLDKVHSISALGVTSPCRSWDRSLAATMS